MFNLTKDLSAIIIPQLSHSNPILGSPNFQKHQAIENRSVQFTAYFSTNVVQWPGRGVKGITKTDVMHSLHSQGLQST